MQNNATIVADIARKSDSARFLLSMYEPVSARPFLHTLIAYNHELAKTRETVTETQLGLIRLQWWRDAVEGIYSGAVAQHPVVQMLAKAVNEKAIDKDDLLHLAYAREFDLEDRLPASLEGLKNYADFTTTPLNRAILRVLNAEEGEDAIKNISTACTMTGLLRSVPFHAAQRRCYLPQDMVASVSDFYAGNAKEIIHAVQVVGEEALRIFNAHNPTSGWMKRQKKLSLMHLSLMKRCGWNVFSQRAQAPPLLREVRLLFV